MHIPAKAEDGAAIRLFHTGKNFMAYHTLGAHIIFVGDQPYGLFRLWAPHARAVSVVGNFNRWDWKKCPMRRVTKAGLWEAACPIQEKNRYAFSVEGENGTRRIKADPYAFSFQRGRPSFAVLSIEEPYGWKDGAWRAAQEKRDWKKGPMAIYEIHLSSWRQSANGRASYRSIADELIPYVKDMGYTHVEFLPLTEYPLEDSWGYQTTGYFAPAARFGNPQDFMYLVDQCHQAGIGVLLDWTPAHFPKDAWGLACFDGSSCYEPYWAEKSGRKDWGTLAFDYDRPEVASFLLSSAMFWLDRYHVDGLRVDAVSVMLFPEGEYSYENGGWNGAEEQGAVRFLRRLTNVAASIYPNAAIIAEDSSTRPLVTGRLSRGGLGFGAKWNMGWMNDTLRYFSLPVQDKPDGQAILAFSLGYALQEAYLLPLSHDEVVHGKGSLWQKMPGNSQEKFAGVRALLAYQMACPGKKLVFMGTELCPLEEWNFRTALQWELLSQREHRHMWEFCRALNHFYCASQPLWREDFSPRGFTPIACDDAGQSILVFCRNDDQGGCLLIVCNFQPVLRADYRVGVPAHGRYRLAFDTDDARYGGNGILTGQEELHSEELPMHGREQSVRLVLPPLSLLFYRVEKEADGAFQKLEKKNAPQEERGESRVYQGNCC